MIDLRWTEAMGVGVSDLDRDHRNVIALLSQLRAALERDSAMAIDVADELIAETRLHFEREERMLDDCRYPRLAPHARGHREAEQELDRLRAAALAGDWVEAGALHGQACATFLLKLLIDDLDYKWFLIDSRIEPRFAGVAVQAWVPRVAGLTGGVGVIPA